MFYINLGNIPFGMCFGLVNLPSAIRFVADFRNGRLNDLLQGKNFSPAVLQRRFPVKATFRSRSYLEQAFATSEEQRAVMALTN